LQTIPTVMIADGMVLARDVETPDGRVLCGKGTQLSTAMLERLKQMDITHVVVEGHPLQLEGEKSLQDELRDIEKRFSRVTDTPPLMYLMKKIQERVIASRSS